MTFVVAPFAFTIKPFCNGIPGATSVSPASAVIVTSMWSSGSVVPPHSTGNYTSEPDEFTAYSQISSMSEVPATAV